VSHLEDFVDERNLRIRQIAVARGAVSCEQVRHVQTAPHRSVFLTYLSSSSSRSASGPNSSSGTEKDVSCRSKYRPATSELKEAGACV